MKMDGCIKISEGLDIDCESLFWIIKVELEHHLGMDLGGAMETYDIKSTRRKRGDKADGKRSPLKSVFGQDLTDTSKTAVVVGNKTVHVPLFVADAGLVIQGSIDKKGIFRLEGTVNRRNMIVNAINNGKKLQECSYTFNDLCTAFKFYIKKLPEPLIPQTITNILFKCLEVQDEVRRKVLLFHTLLLLPKEHLDLLYFLLKLMSDVDSHKEENCMNLENIVTVFAPSIMRDDPKEMMRDTKSTKEYLDKLNTLLMTFARNYEDVGVITNELEQQLNQMRRANSEGALDGKTKKRHRSSSLGRSVMDGFRRIVRGMSPTRPISKSKEDIPNAEVLSVTPDPLRTPCIKKPRKSEVPTLSTKKKKIVQDGLPSGDLLPNTPFRRDHASPRLEAKKTRSPGVLRKGILKSRRSASPTSMSRKNRWSLGKKKAKDKLPCLAKGSHYRSLRSDRHNKPSHQQLEICKEPKGSQKKRKSEHLEVKAEVHHRQDSVVSNQVMILYDERSAKNSLVQEEEKKELPGSVLETALTMSEDDLRVSLTPPNDVSFGGESVSSPPPLPPRATPIPSSETLQDVFEETLKKTEEMKMEESEKLARQLSDKLKIRGRRSAETTPKRSPCQRKITAIRRRSREMQKSRSAGALRKKRSQNMKKRRSIAGPVDAAHARMVIMKSIKRGKPNTVRTGLPTPVKGIHGSKVTEMQDLLRSQDALLVKFSKETPKDDESTLEMVTPCKPSASDRIEINDSREASATEESQQLDHSCPIGTAPSFLCNVSSLSSAFQQNFCTPLQCDLEMSMEEGVDIDCKSISDIYTAQLLQNSSSQATPVASNSQTPKLRRSLTKSQPNKSLTETPRSSKTLEVPFISNTRAITGTKDVVGKDERLAVQKCKNVEDPKYSPVTSLTEEVFEMLSINKDDYPSPAGPQKLKKNTGTESLVSRSPLVKKVETANSPSRIPSRKHLASSRNLDIEKPPQAIRKLKIEGKKEPFFEMGKFKGEAPKSEEIHWVPAVEALKNLENPHLSGTRDSLNILKEKKCVLQMKEKFNNMMTPSEATSIKLQRNHTLTPNHRITHGVTTRTQSFHGGTYLAGRKPTTPKANAADIALMPSPSEAPRKLSVWTPQTETKVVRPKPSLTRSKGTVDTRASFHCSPAKREDGNGNLSRLSARDRRESRVSCHQKTKDRPETSSSFFQQTKGRLEVRSPLRSNSVRCGTGEDPRRSPRLQTLSKSKSTLTLTPKGVPRSPSTIGSSAQASPRKIGTPRSRLDGSKPYRSNRETTMWKSPKYSKAHSLVAVPKDKLPSAKYVTDSSVHGKLPLRDRNTATNQTCSSGMSFSDKNHSEMQRKVSHPKRIPHDPLSSKENTFVRRGSSRNSNRNKSKVRQNQARTTPKRSQSYSQSSAKLARRSPRFHSVM